MKDRNIPHSVATRLLHLARKGGESYEFILLRYGPFATSTLNLTVIP